jgi:hypothetical protein
MALMTRRGGARRSAPASKIDYHGEHGASMADETPSGCLIVVSCVLRGGQRDTRRVCIGWQGGSCAVLAYLAAGLGGLGPWLLQHY